MKPAINQLDAEVLYKQLLSQLKQYFSSVDDLYIVGIRSGGAWIAQRLAQDLQLKTPPGFVDVSFYRDDYAEKGLPSQVKPTQIPFNVEQATILLVDDILYTGRTTRAAINELFDYGRPKRIYLATLIDRGDRELPIAADFKAAQASLDKKEILVLKQNSDKTFILTVENA